MSDPAHVDRDVLEVVADRFWWLPAVMSAPHVGKPFHPIQISILDHRLTAVRYSHLISYVIDEFSRPCSAREHRHRPFSRRSSRISRVRRSLLGRSAGQRTVYRTHSGHIPSLREVFRLGS